MPADRERAAPARRRPVHWLDAAAALLGLGLLAVWMHPAATRPLTWDEVDYVVAARAGTWANLTDRGAMGPITFARFALAKAGRGDADAVVAAAGYVEDENLLNVRHWHPPGGLLLVAPAVALAGPERGARLTQLGWIALLALLTLALLREVAPDRPGVRATGVLVVLLDPLTRNAVLEAHVHVAVAAAFLLPLWVWLRATRDPLEARRLGRVRESGRPGPPSAPMAGAMGAAVLGLSLGVLWAFAVVGPLWTALWVAVLLVHRDARDWLGRDGGAPWACAGVLAALLVLWPAAFTKISLIQNYALRLYALLFQGGREWGGAGSALLAFIRATPSLAVYAALGAAALARGLLRGRRDALSAGAAAIAFLVVMVPFAILDRYLLPLLPLAVVAGATLVTAGDPERAYRSSRDGAASDLAIVATRPGGIARLGPVLVAALIAVCWALAPGFDYPQPARADQLRAEYARVDALAARGEEVLAEGGHIFRFYGGAGRERIRSVLVDYDGRRLLLRDGVRYDTVSLDRRSWIVLQRRTMLEPAVMDELSARCRRVDVATHVHFGCGGVGGPPAP